MSETRAQLERRIKHTLEKADELLKLGDATGGAEGRRLLRECRRWRMKTKQLRELLVSRPRSEPIKEGEGNG